MIERVARVSPWGQPLVIADAHVHFFSRSFFRGLVSQKPGLTLEAAAVQLGWDLPPPAVPDEEPRELADIWARELDRHGVAVAALIGSLPGEQEAVVAAARAHPDRFLAYAMVNPRAIDPHTWPPAAFAEVHAACLFPAMHLYPIQDECVRPVLDWAARNQRAVFVHCGVLSVGVRARLGLPSPFDMRYSNPLDLHALALRYPQVPFLVPHFGAGFFREALMLADLCPNVYLDTSSSNQWMRYQESHLDLRQVFRRALDVAGPKRLLFGTDSSFFPRGWHQAVFEDQARALYELGVDIADARAIFGENLLRILSRSPHVIST
jgi:predicted TIM-barrel fold metal-dependent hydrolase